MFYYLKTTKMNLFLIHFLVALPILSNWLIIVKSEPVNLYKGKICCQQNMPLKPIFDANGHLIDYVPQECPQQYLVCCKGYIGLYGVCLSIFNRRLRKIS